MRRHKRASHSVIAGASVRLNHGYTPTRRTPYLYSDYDNTRWLWPHRPAVQAVGRCHRWMHRGPAAIQSAAPMPRRTPFDARLCVCATTVLSSALRSLRARPGYATMCDQTLSNGVAARAHRRWRNNARRLLLWDDVWRFVGLRRQNVESIARALARDDARTINRRSPIAQICPRWRHNAAQPHWRLEPRARSRTSVASAASALAPIQ
jgi:hypothetical protein